MLKAFSLWGLLWVGVNLTAEARGLPDFSGLVEKQGAAVVTINVIRTSPGHQEMQDAASTNDPFPEFFRYFAHKIRPEQDMQASGSGFIISPDGYILTNWHVVDGADKIVVKLANQREFQAVWVGVDRRTDLVLLKVAASGLPFVVRGNPGKLKVGEWVAAIGSPFGFESSVTAGIVSAKSRYLPENSLIPFIQTDVAVNPGSSGSPLFNLQGQVVGINSRIYTRSGGAMGVSFAIPSDVAFTVAEQLRATGKVVRGYIGMSVQESGGELVESLGQSDIQGVLVSAVEHAAPAERAGIEVGDVLLEFGGVPVHRSGELSRLAAAAAPGHQVKVDLWRKGSGRQVTTVMVAEMPEENLAPTGLDGDADAEVAASVARLGIVVSEPVRGQQQEKQVQGGLQVDKVMGQAARSAGLQPGDVLLAVGNVRLYSLAQLNELLLQVPVGQNVALLVRHGGSADYMAIQLDTK
jgi:serine protease Do